MPIISVRFIDAAAFTAFFLAHVPGSTGSRQRTQPKATLVYSVPAPGTEAIEDFRAFADLIYEQIKANELVSKQLEELPDALSPRLMSGEIDVSKVDLTQLNSHLSRRRRVLLQIQGGALHTRHSCNSRHANMCWNRESLVLLGVWDHLRTT